MFKRTNNNKEPEKIEKSKMATSFQLVRGMKDVLPEDQEYFLWIFDTVRSLSAKLWI